VVCSAMKLSIIIPVYNEAKTIARVLDTVSAVPYDKEIIVVEDGPRLSLHSGK